MKRVALLLHEDVYASSIGGVLDLFADANGCLQEGGKTPAFALEPVSYTTIDKAQQPDLIIIPGFKGDSRMILRKYDTVVPWISEMYRQGTEIASMCSGSFFLYATNISIDQVSSLCHTGKRNFIRRFKAATNNTPIEYLQRVRIEAAKKVLENEDCGLDELMYRAGYEDIKTFRMIFKRITGLSPRDYRKKYSRRENVTS